MCMVGKIQFETASRRAFALAEAVQRSHAHNIAALRGLMPPFVIDHLVAGDETASLTRNHPHVAVLVADIAGFTAFCGRFVGDAPGVFRLINVRPGGCGTWTV